MKLTCYCGPYFICPICWRKLYRRAAAEARAPEEK